MKDGEHHTRGMIQDLLIPDDGMSNTDAVCVNLSS